MLKQFALPVTVIPLSNCGSEHCVVAANLEAVVAVVVVVAVVAKVAVAAFPLMFPVMICVNVFIPVNVLFDGRIDEVDPIDTQVHGGNPVQTWIVLSLRLK